MEAPGPKVSAAQVSPAGREQELSGCGSIRSPRAAPDPDEATGKRRVLFKIQ